uniref:DNA polymerase n=1 Tax=Silene vulgaris TaxID=42043 RepID=A0A3G2BRZ1_SILVU|nr:DNA polymerase [Silene vulgaris]
MIVYLYPRAQILKPYNNNNKIERRGYHRDTKYESIKYSFKYMSQLVQDLDDETKETLCHVPYLQLVITSRYFHKGIRVNEDKLLTLAVMDLFVQYVYPALNSYAKANVFFILKPKPNKEDLLNPHKDGEIIKSLSKTAFPLTKDDDSLIKKFDIKNYVNTLIEGLLEIYSGYYVTGITIRNFFEHDIISPIPVIDYKSRIYGLIECYYDNENDSNVDIKNIRPKSLRSTKKVYLNNLTSKKTPDNPTIKPFMVADIETVVIDEIHVPYAIGVLKVYPGVKVLTDDIDTFYSENYNKNLFPKFEDRSQKLMLDFINRLITITRRNSKYKMNVIYFHNLSSFDGLFLIKHMIYNHQNYELKPIIRENVIYEIAVCLGKRVLFRLRDSLHLLPCNLDSLAKSLCPELGGKGSIDFSKVTLETLSSMKDELLTYMKHDIRLLGSIMQNFQKLYFEQFQADIVDFRTLSSLAMSLFRSRFYKDDESSIYIPEDNEEEFIRRGYYGGHTDCFIPKGDNLYYYDVNSLYPYIMKESQMPGGKPVWHSDLSQMDLDDIYGFIEAYIECPESIKRPLLPYKDPKNNTVIFPTGKFVGVHFSEELKLARKIGYKITPLKGYLFNAIDSPFEGYVKELFESRLKAKAEGNAALSFIYKLLMNSLYGRFGINPEYSKTELCNESRLKSLLRGGPLINKRRLRDDLYMVSYRCNTSPRGKESPYKVKKTAAVQIAAAITSKARVYMYEHLSRDDCYYTDTDSIVLGSPLPDKLVSPTELGKFKLEDKIKEGIFLAPKSYWYSRESSQEDVIRYKGEGKKIVDKKYYIDQYLDPSRTQKKKVIKNFKRDLETLSIRMVESVFTFRVIDNNKRGRLIENGIWVGSIPIHIIDFESIDHKGRMIINQLIKERDNLIKKINNKKNDDEKDDSINNKNIMDPQNCQKNEVNTANSNLSNKTLNDVPSDTKTKPEDSETRPDSESQKLDLSGWSHERQFGKELKDNLGKEPP